MCSQLQAAAMEVGCTLSSQRPYQLWHCAEQHARTVSPSHAIKIHS